MSIAVLRDWSEVGRCIGFLRKIGYGYHDDAIKNWDMFHIAKLLKGFKKNARILDMGCSGSAVLEFCYRAGFQNVIGIDFFRTLLLDRVKQTVHFVQNGFKVPYRIKHQDLTKTKFKDGSFDCIICLSVIEHGVSVERFLRESSRLLTKGGSLYVSTDYWDKKIRTEGGAHTYGMKWKIFSREEIQELIRTAKKYDLHLKKNQIPPVKDKVSKWNGKEYTFISMIFSKR